MKRAGYLYTEKESRATELKDTILWKRTWSSLGIPDNFVTVANANNFWKYILAGINNQHDDEICDELVLLSSEMVGPLYDLPEAFQNMQNKKLDFWGLVRNYTCFNGFTGKYPSHVDPRFLVIRKSCYKVMMTDDFQSEVSKKVVEGFPFLTAFAYMLEASGCKAETYCDTELWENNRHCNNFILYYGKAYELIKEHRCPFIPCDIFATKNLATEDGRDARKTFEYIIKDLKYPEIELWHDLLKKFDISDLYHGLHLDYVIDDISENNKKQGRRVAVIIHVYYRDLFTQIIEYIENIPDGIDIYITTSVEENVDELNRLLAEKKIGNVQIRLVANRGRDCSALFIGCKSFAQNYEYICFIHDKKTSGNNGAFTIGEAFMANLFENMLGGKCYINNILGLFQENKALGLLAPPIPSHGQYFCLKNNAWTSCFDKTLELAEKIGIDINILMDKPPFVLSTTFWCRTEALKPLWDYEFSYEDFCEEPMPEDGTISHAIERILPYVAQGQGYYSGIVMSRQYASLLISNLNYQLWQAVSRLGKEYSISTYRQFEGFDIERLYSFCEAYERIYIYGAGVYGKRYAEILAQNNLQFEGFLVSKRNGEMFLDGHNIYAVRDLIENHDIDINHIGVLVAVSEYYQEEIVETLGECGIDNYMIV